MTILGPNGQPLPPITSPKQGGRSIGPGRLNPIQARYDATKITRDNEIHWSQADNLSPNRANSPSVRRRLRARSRYEAVENNSILKGMVLTLCNDFVSRGPRPICTDPRLSEKQRKEYANVFHQYCRAINLRQLLWRLRHAKCVDGEAFAIQHTDTTLPPGMPMVNWFIVEAEQCTTEYNEPETQYQVDGIRFDRYGRPREYYFLYHHPSDNYLWSSGIDGRWISNRYVIHWLRKERPWQRGVPETTPALPHCAYLRRYNLAVLAAAESAANMAGIVKTASNPYPTNTNFGPQSSAGTECDYEPFDSFPMERGMWTMLPDGYDTYQFKAEQPTQAHDAFVDTVLREIARCMQMPFNIAVGHSGGYNFASGTLDKQMYNNTIQQERGEGECLPLAHIHQSWFREAIRIPAYLPPGIADMEYIVPPSIEWSWGIEPEHADPAKVTESIIALWEKGLLTDEQILSTRFNVDPAVHYESLSRMMAEREKLDLPLPGGTPVPAPEGSDSSSTKRTPAGKEAKNAASKT